jgi:cytochrome c551
VAPPTRKRRNVSRRRKPRRSNTRVQIVFAVVALVVVGALVLSMVFAGGSGDDTDDAGSEQDASFDAAVAYRVRCSGCHGANGDGGTGPKLSDGAVVRAYPDIDDEIAVVTNGRGRMPAFKDRDMSADEIRAVVEYTRTQL